MRFLLLLLLLPSLLLAQGQAQVPGGEGAFTTFGQLGQVGSFRAHFSRQGAGLVWLQAGDHYVTTQAKRKDEHALGDYLLLLDSNDHALRLFHEQRSPAFPVDPATAMWQREDLTDGVKFTLDGGNGLVLEKVLRHDAQWRGFTIEVTLRNEDSDAVGNLPFQLGGPALVNPAQSGLFGDVSVAIAAPIGDGEVEIVKPALGSVQQLAVDPSVLQFAGSTNRFFGAFLWPKDEASRAALTQFTVDTLPPRPAEAGETPDNPTTRVRYGMNLAVPLKGQATTLSYGIYLGPKSFRVFETLPEPERFAPVLDYDLNPPCCGIDLPGGRPMAKLLLWLLGVFHDFLDNWGFAIILLTVLVRGCLLPVNFHMQKSMRAYGSKMAKLKPKMDEMKKKFGDDQKGYQQAMIQFQREHKIMPPLGGCLPIFLTMPIYIGLFTALRTAYDLRQEPFIAWIDDLSSSDAMFQLGFWPDNFNLLPLLWIGLFVTMTLRQPLPTDPQQRQMQQMMRYMPMIFGVMLYSYASALLLYMVTSMLWSLVESALVKKVLGPIDPNVGAMAPTPM